MTSSPMATRSQRVFKVEPSLSGFPVTFWFNQFSVETESGGVVMSFGCIFKGRLLDEVLSFAMPRESLEMARESIIEYLGRSGEILPIEPAIIRPANKIMVVNLIGMSYRGETAETLLHNYPFKRTLTDAEESSFEADPVALLRSPLNVQRNLIRALYH
jgi:hypothetical protein